jgi:hypothetical protein
MPEQKPIVDSDRCSDCPARKCCNALTPKSEQKPDTGWDAEGCGALIQPANRDQRIGDLKEKDGA